MNFRPIDRRPSHLTCGAVSWRRPRKRLPNRIRRPLSQLAGTLPIRHKRLVSELDELRLLLQRYPLFDTAWYRSQLGDTTLTDDELPAHYIFRGAVAGLNPNPLFFTEWYRAEYPDTKVNPLLHYLREGEAAGNQPNPYFLTSWYRRRHLAGRTDLSPLNHWVNEGGTEECTPNPCFDFPWYAEFYNVDQEDRHPFVHFLSHPASLLLQPNPWFDAVWYQKRYLAADDPTHPLQHYIEHALSEKTEPNQLFDSAWYVSEYPDAAAENLPALAHYLEHKDEDVSPNQWFDPAWYRDTYRTDETWDYDPYLHFVLWGEKFFHNPGPNFNTFRYLLRYPEVADSGLEPFHHFFVVGRHAGNSACAKGVDNTIGLYEAWREAFFAPAEADRVAIRSHIAAMRRRPLFSVIMPVYNPPPALLREAIESVRGQLYDNWEFCIADDASSDPEVRALLEHYRDIDPRIKVVFRSENGHISRASNSALELVTGEYTALLDHDDLITEDALYHVAATLEKHPDAGLIFSDEDKILPEGNILDPYLKGDYDPWLLLGHNMVSHFGVYRTDLLRRIGGFRPGYEGAQDYDLTLRTAEQIPESAIVHIPRVLYHWRIIPGSTAGGNEEKPYAIRASEKALNESLRRRSIPCEVEIHPVAGGMHLASFAEMEKESCPLVSIIIPTRNGAELVRTCITSIVDKTDYPRYEILLVDNGSDDPEALALFAELEKKENIHLLRDDAPFNYSRLNNRAAAQAQGEVLLLLNNDTEVIEPDWLTEMAGLAIQPGVGAVGARLLYPDHTLQHAGVVLGIRGCAGHIFMGVPEKQVTFFYLNQLHHAVGAVTGACLAVRRDLYHEVGGLNETDFAVGYNDVDLCLKLKAQNLRNVYASSARLYHYESISRGAEDTPEKKRRFWDEMSLLKKRWPDVWYHDPAYSPGLTIERGDYSLALPPRIALNAANWPPPFPVSCYPQQVEGLRILLIHNDTCGGDHPLLAPVRQLEEEQKIHSWAVATSSGFTLTSARADGWFDAVATDTSATGLFWFRHNVMRLQPLLLHIDSVASFVDTRISDENIPFQSLVHAARFTTTDRELISTLEERFGLQIERFCRSLDDDAATTLLTIFTEIRMKEPLPASALRIPRRNAPSSGE